jgi:hypothetical protein
MTPPKKTEVRPVDQNKSDENLMTKTKQPLVFISHDSRDSEIAEAFSKLLSSVSAGVLKSFRSSDKKGTQGIEYGVEWFPEIMRKLDTASDIVCLLTRNSVDRPWILYEAGVAKGKLTNTVLGIAIGIPLNKANKGPFAQFQNCEDDENSLTKLVLQLVKRIPNAEPDEEIIKEQVRSFIQKLTELIKTQPKSDSLIETNEETSTAKLFEEVKIMFQDLPSRIDKRLDPDLVSKRRRRFHPKYIEEIMHMSSKFDDPFLGYLMYISYLKDEMPWLYEVGIETYRTLKNSKSKVEKQKSISTFMNYLEMCNHPIFFETFGRNEESYIFMKEMRHFVMMSLDKFFTDERNKE